MRAGGLTAAGGAGWGGAGGYSIAGPALGAQPGSVSDRNAAERPVRPAVGGSQPLGGDRGLSAGRGPGREGRRSRGPWAGRGAEAAAPPGRGVSPSWGSGGLRCWGTSGLAPCEGPGVGGGQCLLLPQAWLPGSGASCGKRAPTGVCLLALEGFCDFGQWVWLFSLFIAVSWSALERYRALGVGFLDVWGFYCSSKCEAWLLGALPKLRGCAISCCTEP